MDGCATRRSSSVPAASASVGSSFRPFVAAALQRELRDGTPVFLLKGGVFIERVLGVNARTTKDVDTLYRGAEADLVHHLDRALAEPWGEITFFAAQVPDRT